MATSINRPVQSDDRVSIAIFRDRQVPARRKTAYFPVSAKNCYSDNLRLDGWKLYTDV